jgi:hypothetical protein
MPPVLTGDPEQVQIGAGSLYVAAIGTTDPANIAAVTGASATFREVGWTEDGSAISFTTTNEKIFVEEEFYPVKTAVTEVVATIAFVMAQSTRRNLALALNAGHNEANDDTLLEPPNPGEELRVKLIHVTDAGAMYIFRRCLQTGTIELGNQKAPDYKKIPVTFDLEKPAGAVKPWAVKPNTAGLI